MSEIPHLISARNVDEVLELHRLPPSALEGKVVLDLGCGYSDLEIDLRDRGVTSSVIGVDGSPEALLTEDGNERDITLIAANLTALPILDNSVDMVLATYSMPFYGRNRSDIKAFYKECQRVVKVGGILSIFPIGVSILPKKPRKLGDKPSKLGNIGFRVLRNIDVVMGATSIQTSRNWKTIRESRGLLTAQKLK